MPETPGPRVPEPWLLQFPDGARYRFGVGEIVSRAPGLLTRSVRSDVIASVPGQNEVVVGGSGAAVLRVLDTPATPDEIVARIIALGGRPDDGVDGRALVEEAIEALQASEIVAIDVHEGR